MPDSSVHEATERLHAGDISGAEEICAELVEAFSGHASVIELQFNIHLASVKKRFPGPDYLQWLSWFHAKLKPRNYVEIGVESGQSLQFAQTPTRAVGIDPEIQIVHSQETWVKLFKLTSDEFFIRHDLRATLGGGHPDLAFIDGLHTFDQALKDFINIERFSTPASVVLFHDIFPAIQDTALRERQTRFWVGDTWKVMLILLKYRPDLTIFTIPAFPSGLGVVTKLDSKNETLHGNFKRIVEESMACELASYHAEIDKHLNVVANQFDTVGSLLGNAGK